MINRSIYRELKAAEAFVTMFCALYDPATSVFQYPAAGHNPPIRRSASGTKCVELSIGGMPIGIFPDSEFPNGEFTMDEGDIVVIYTDGIVEAKDRSGSLFGFERLCSVVDRSHGSDAEGIMNAILSELDSYTDGSPQADDITIVVLKKTEGVVLEQ
jgi:sigma-B regulation protein RsbU (phosphoserine phosphatase)